MTSEPATPPVFRSRRLTHANLFVGDLEGAVRFWTEVAGLVEVLREEALQASFLTNGATHHDIAVIQAQGDERRGRDGEVQIAATAGAQPGLNHLAWELDSEADVVAGYTRARERGTAIDRCLDHMVARSIYLKDPDGNGVELYADTTARWHDVFRQHAGELVTVQWDPLAGEADARSHRQQRPKTLAAAGAALAPRQIVGAVLAVGDLARSVEFYRDVAGLTVRAGSVGGRGVLMAAPMDGVGLGLIAADSAGPSLRRVIFSLRDDAPLAEAARRVGLAGARAIADGASLLVADPDGTTCEFRPPDRAGPVATDGGADGAALTRWLEAR